MWSSARTIAPGDTVIVYMTRDSLEPLVVTPNAVLHNKWGMYPHNSFIGLPYGCKVRSSAPSNSGPRSRGGKGAQALKAKDTAGGGGSTSLTSAGESASTGGFLYILRPTPELWTLSLPHRTQILYLADITFISTHLALRPGSRVVEAGTGSGSFSHSIARSVGKQGKLFTFEFHEQRAEKARREFEDHGLSPGVVRLEHRNVCKDGFGEGVFEEGGEGVDAVFLDLPAPWEAIPHAKKVMRKDTVSRICCFSPCIEQVIRTVTALNDAGFSEITMFETLLRPIEVSTIPKLPSIEDATERLKAAEIKREEKRLRQIRANREAEALDKAIKGKPSSASAPGKRKPDVDAAESGEGAAGGNAGEGEGLEAKRVKIIKDDGGDTGDAATPMQEDELPTPPVPVFTTTQITSLPIISSSSPSSSSRPNTNTKFTTNTTTNTHWSQAGPGKLAVSKALPEVRGHTSYLTFACLVPYEYAAAAARQTESAEKEKEKAEGEVNGTDRTSAEVSEPSSVSADNTTKAEPMEKTDV